MRSMANHGRKGPAAVFNILITCVFFVGCSSPVPYAPVSDRRQPPSIKINSHRVSAGETLYSIAWRYNLDYRRLAARNGLNGGYTIYPGQLLSLDLKGKPPVRQVAKAPVKAVPARPKAKPKPRITPKVAPAPVRKAPAPRSIKKPPATKSSPAPVATRGPLRWRWPAQGKLLSRYSSGNGLNKGIDIAGKKGESVVAAAPGSVVYAGSGLRGYGNLLIIKHNQTYLSAYAHNRRLLVGEGDRISTGQKVAELGSSGTDRNKLHFEIRRDGKPIDPLQYLPKR